LVFGSAAIPCGWRPTPIVAVTVFVRPLITDTVPLKWVARLPKLGTYTAVVFSFTATPAGETPTGIVARTFKQRRWWVRIVAASPLTAGAVLGPDGDASAAAVVLAASTSPAMADANPGKMRWLSPTVFSFLATRAAIHRSRAAARNIRRIGQYLCGTTGHSRL